MTDPFSKVAQHKFTVNNKKFISNAWPVRSKAFKNLPIIGGTFAVPISIIYGSGGENMQEAMAMATELFFQKLADPEADQLVELILEDVFIQKNGGVVPLDLDNDFDDLDELLQVLAEVLKQHYGKLISGKGSRSLFGVMVPLAEVVAPKPDQASPA